MKARSQSSSTPKKPFRQSGIQENASRWTMTAVLRELKTLADPKVRAKLAYFGVHVRKAYGISAPVLHQFAKHIGKDHRLAQQLWTTGVHEARILATLIGESEKVSSAEMDRWVRDFDSWDVVDAACCYLYAHAKPALSKAAAWSRRRGENRSAGCPRRTLDCRGRAARIEECGRAKTASTEDRMNKTAKGGSNKELKIRQAKSADAPEIAALAGQLGYPATAAQMGKR